ncbi:ABC transporter substrate-binding protein [Secundilactobacillus oryzae JCM 18671]|uniref:ABC transporter substrate-binding protein n=2 Tax=Secundilactobacillus oryzae TaxID=1202668 RepID=A0A081BIW3_9LACO|nr:ABC transporter substrate-binding protein [Secundilactobacillus oryzae JCM 18671]
MMILISVVFGAMAALMSGCASTAVGGQSIDKTLKITIPGEPATADPTKVIETNGGAVTTQTQEGIYRKNADNKIVAGTVEKIVKPTENGTKYTFTIRKSAKWQDGKAVTAADFVNAIQRQADPTTKSQSTESIQYLENFDAVNSGKMKRTKLGIHAINDRTFYVKLTRQVPYMNYEFMSFYPLETSVVNKYGDKYGTSATTMSANGPYVMKDWTGTNDKWTYVKNKNYWNAKNVKISNVKVTVVKEDSTAANMFNSGQVQLTSISGQYVKQNKGNKEMVVTKTARNNYLYFNNKRKVTSNENIRHAISLVINRKQLATNVLGDGSAVSDNIVPSGLATNPKTGEDFNTEMGNLAPTDIKKAMEYWEKAKKELGIKTATLDLLTDDVDNEKKLGQYVQGTVQKNLKGLKINVVSVPHATHVSRDFSASFDIATVGWGPDYNDADNFLAQMIESGSINFSKFKDDKYEAIMKKVEQTDKYTAEERYEFQKQADKRLMEIAAVAPTYQASQAHLISSKIGGLKYDAFSGSGSPLQYAYWK